MVVCCREINNIDTSVLPLAQVLLQSKKASKLYRTSHVESCRTLEHVHGLVRWMVRGDGLWQIQFHMPLAILKPCVRTIFLNHYAVRPIRGIVDNLELSFTLRDHHAAVVLAAVQRQDISKHPDTV